MTLGQIYQVKLEQQSVTEDVCDTDTCFSLSQ